MARGGSRNRSGPQPDPNSARSERRGYSLTALPAAGFDGDVPDFPLPRITRFNEYFADGKKVRESDEGATDAFRDRELAVWAEAWATPQACAWSMESWRWPTVAEFCRLKTIVELEPDANASLVGQLHRFRDQIGLTPAGLRENGWAIAAAKVDDDEDAPEAPASPTSSRDRMKLVAGNG